MSVDYPVSLRLQGLHVAVIGGGVGTERRVRDLVEVGAVVHLICSPDKVDSHQFPYADINWQPRSYQSGDLEGMFLVVSCPGDPALATCVWQEAQQLGVLINTVDDPAHANFAFPAIHRQGDVTLAVSSGGKSPCLAVALRNQLSPSVGPEYSTFLDLLAGIRAQVKGALPRFRQRLPVWKGLIASDALMYLRQGKTDRAKAQLQQDLKRLLAENTLHK